MTIELNGKVTEGDSWNNIHIDGESLTDFAEEINGKICKLKYYVSNEPIKKETVIEDFLRSFYEGKTEIDGTYCYGSSWTGVYAKNDFFDVGGHDIVEELNKCIGKYCYLTVETDD